MFIFNFILLGYTGQNGCEKKRFKFLANQIFLFALRYSLDLLIDFQYLLPVFVLQNTSIYKLRDRFGFLKSSGDV